MQLSVNATGFEALEKSLDELEEALREIGRKKSEVYHCLYELGLDVSPLPAENGRKEMEL